MKKITPVLLTAFGLASSAFAEWKPGLNEGLITNAASVSPGVYPASYQVVMGPQKGREKAWGNTTTYVYVGQIYLDGSTYWFGESIDDATYLKIDGTVLINDSNWQNFATGSITREAGWYDFEVRFYNGGGGCGVANGAVDKDGMSCGFGYCKGTKPTSMSTCAFPLDDGSGVFFRCDDGLGFSDQLEVAQSPFALPVEMTPSSVTNGLLAQDAVSCSSATSYLSEDETLRGTLSGYIISNIVDGVRAERSRALDGTSSFTYVHDGHANALTWVWAIEYKLTVRTEGEGTVDVGTGWHARGEQVTLTAGSGFVGWQGDIDPSQALQPTITLTMDRARSVLAVFGVSDVYVDAANGNDANSGFSPDKPKKTFAAAMAIAGSGFTVHVKPGTYSVSAETSVGIPLVIRGEGAKPEDVVIKGNKSNGVRIFRLNHAQARLENLTVSGGNLYGESGSKLKYGGNVLIDAAGGVVTNCVLTDCKQQYHSIGGGVYVDSEDGLVTRCRITACSMTDGNAHGGTAVGLNRGRVEYCLIDGNYDAQTASPNSTEHGAVYVKGGTLDHCTVVDNEHLACALYMTGGQVSNCVFARNHSFYHPQADQIRTSSAAVRNEITDCVWDGGDINAACPQGVVKFADFASADYRLTSDSAGHVSGGYDWGCYETDESTTVVEAVAPSRIDVAAGGDVADALRRVAEGGEVVLAAGTHKTTGRRPLILKRGITLRGDGADNTAVLLKNGATDMQGGLVTLSHADARLCGLTLCDHRPNGNNQCSSGIQMVQDGGLVSNCVVRNIGMLSTSSHAGAALRIRKPGAHVTCCVFSNCVIHANTGTGGCLSIEANGSQIDNCLIADCNNDTWKTPTSSHWTKDSAAALYQTAGTVAHCTFVECKAPVAVSKVTGGVVRECVFFGNARFNTNYPEDGSVAIGAGTGNWMNVVSDVTTFGTGGILATAANIGFVDPANANWRLKGNSVAVNVGGRFPFAGVPSVDLDGRPRRVAARVDAGCYENQRLSGLRLIVR